MDYLRNSSNTAFSHKAFVVDVYLHSYIHTIISLILCNK